VAVCWASSRTSSLAAVNKPSLTSFGFFFTNLLPISLKLLLEPKLAIGIPSRNSLHPAFLQHSSKKAKAFFICCFCNEAWAVLLTAAKTTGPINIHGCLTKNSEFPPDEKKLNIISKTNQQLKDIKDLHAIHMDCLPLIKDKQTLLFLLLT
jgi:hypothetical protein